MSGAAGRGRGFALLITIVLLAFLVLLLVSLAALTRVETQVAGNNRVLSQARQNALMGLNIALGQAQVMLGPDTRVTAPASQKGDGASAYNAADFDNNSNWTGVYRRDPSASARTPRLLNWLVSGNEAVSVPASGGNTPGFTPDAAVTGLDQSMSATTAVTVGGAPAALMVGRGSTVTGSDPSAINRFVVAPLVNIQADSSLVPGAGASGAPQRVGRFAYWVGDESVKAKVSLVDPWQNPSAATLNASVPPVTTAQAGTYRFVNAQRPAIEFIHTDGSRLGSAYPAGSTVLPRVQSLSQLPLVNQAAAVRLTEAARRQFHDLTASSLSVLADTAAGGLKKDLTAWAADSSPASPAPDDLIAPGAAADAGKYGLPRWGLLHDYLNTRDASGAAVAARPRTPTQAGVYPVITYARLAYNVTCPEAANWSADPAGTLYRYRFNIMPAMVLWNPFNVPISKDSELEFCFKYTRFNNAALNDQVQFALWDDRSGLTDNFDILNLTRIGVTRKGTGTFTAYGAGNANQFWRFKVALSRDLAPGESRLFTLHDDHDQTVYSPGVSKLGDATVAPENAVYLPSAGQLSRSDIENRELCIRSWTYQSSGGSPRAQIEFLLSRPPPASATSAAAIETALRDASCQQLLGSGFGFNVTATKRVINKGSILLDYLTIAFYHRVELAMSTITSAESRGEFSGTPRWLATLNPTAPTVLRLPSTTRDATPSYVKQDYWNLKYPPTPALVNSPVPQDDSGGVSAGTKVSPPSPVPAQKLVLREFQRADVPAFSIAQLQHANVSTLNLNPAYAIGNSAANLHVARTATDSGALTGDIYAGFPAPTSFNRVYDLSYLLNEALWDGWFFSTVPPALTADEVKNASYRLPNARHRFHLPDGMTSADAAAALTAPGTAAAHLLLDGGFNVNSTSVEAWRALLASHNGVATDPSDATKSHPFSRFASPAAGAEPNNAGSPWMSWRILSDAQIDALAAAIVAEVRARGPFLSLADFVNRRLVADDTGLKGALQAAIDATSGAASINGVAPFTDAALRVTDYPADLPVTDAEQRAIYLGGTDATQPASSRAAYAPGFLTQADILSAIGPQLTARADTLRIRAYGDVMNPAAGSADPEARAWCEAIVQRLPGYVDPQDAATAAPAALRPVNAGFGRRFQIVSFRWLSPDEI